MKKLTLLTLTLLLPLLVVMVKADPGSDAANTQKVANFLQDISVTIKAEGEYSSSEGSGVLITRKIDGRVVTFVWTCGHVVDNLRRVRDVIEDGKSKKIVEFDGVRIVKELVEDGRRVGEINMDARVIKYSDADDGEDLALLMVGARDYGKASAKFLINQKNDIVPIGTNLYHVGSLLGQFGSNSMTSGIVSQVGRVRNKVIYDQTTVTAFPGSSGGGVYLRDGTYVGMIVRGAGEGFNLMVPIRRMVKWATKHDILWAIDPSKKVPSVEDINKLPIESVSRTSASTGSKKKKEFNTSYPQLIRTLDYTSDDINISVGGDREFNGKAELKFR